MLDWLALRIVVLMLAGLTLAIAGLLYHLFLVMTYPVWLAVVLSVLTTASIAIFTARFEP